MSSLAARLLALHQLHVRGLLTDEEFARAKAREIERTAPASTRPSVHGPAAAAGTAPTPPPAATTRTLNPVVPGVGLALGAASIANGGLTG